MVADWVGVVVGFAGGVLTALLADRFTRRRDRADRTGADVRAAQDRLVELREGYRRREEHGTDPDDVAIGALEDRWDVAASRLADDEVTTLGSTYKYVGGLYAAGDPLTGLALEQQAFDALTRVLRAQLRGT